ncbi:MAG: D-arabinono-1,4-lactone oxidase [Actinomycetota bacterium]
MSQTNWAANLVYDAHAVHSPTSIEELQELVAGADRVKAIGTRHSFTPVADSPGGIQVSLERLPADVVIDPVRMTARVGAGLSYGAVAEALEAQGYALANLASLPHISIAGGATTGTHGSGDGNGMLATSIAAVEIVTHDGSLALIDRHGTDLPAVAMGLGAFGVITRVELDIQPSYRIRQDLYDRPSWAAVLASFDELMASAYSVSLMGPYGPAELNSLWQKQRLDSELSPAPSSAYGGSLRRGPLPEGHPYTPQGEPGPWSERLAHFRLDAAPSMGGDELQSEYFVAREHGVAALEALRRLGDRIDPHLHGTEIRTVAGDDLWLSPAYRRPSVCIGFTWRKHPAEVTALLPEIEEALEPFDPRPHWGKLFALRDLAARFPKLPSFLDVADRLDPTQTFWNPFLDRLRT